MMEEIRIGRIFILVSQNPISLPAKIELCLVFSYHVFPDRIQQTMNGGLMVLNGFLVKIGTPLVVTYLCKLVRSQIGLSAKLRR